MGGRGKQDRKDEKQDQYTKTTLENSPLEEHIGGIAFFTLFCMKSQSERVEGVERQ